MPAELSFFAAVVIGILGSTHCIGMCGGIVGALSVGMPQSQTKSNLSQLMFHLAYNTGRITSYAIAGAIAGLIGAGLLGFMPAFELPVGRLIAAAFMIALGLYLANWWKALIFLEKLGAKFWVKIKPLGLRFLPANNPYQAFGLGLVWGWLPCGLVYSVVAWSMTSGDWLTGSLLMAGFGLGTLPSLLVVGAAVGKFNFLRQSQTLRTMAGILMIAFGLYSGVASFGNHHHQTGRQEATLQNPDVALNIQQTR